MLYEGIAQSSTVGRVGDDEVVAGRFYRPEQITLDEADAVFEAVLGELSAEDDARVATLRK